MDYGKMLRQLIAAVDYEGIVTDDIEFCINAFAQQRYDAGWADASHHARPVYSDDLIDRPARKRVNTYDDLTTPPRVALP